ncbi:hypothetical protein [Thioalkalivibrio sp. XN279]|uniref:hypothetical protein n=1 Tax=Thioalkalivibrio sp. XN279 TaxID=2714953 RepID=UPI00140D7151|nr:hypothetical protein [Thioalkalivibrio sp. XN279]NHA14610.1 hypothetical protein [Thioalkalivibrio sp. XN279]
MSSLDSELAHLWSQRHAHDPRVLERLCTLIQQQLISFRPPKEFSQLQSLDGLPSPADRARQYVQDFLLDKVLTGKGDTTCESVRALKVFYRRYLIDVIRSHRTRGKYLQSDTVETSGEVSVSIIENTAAPESNPDFEELESLNIRAMDVRDSARRFLEQQESWVQAFLALSYCPGSDSGETMQALARRLNVRSYAYKAGKLGFNWHGESPDAFFEETLVGQWIVGLGIPITRDNRAAVRDALKILCQESLLIASDQEGVQP